jgi:hypothetical protein
MSSNGSTHPGRRLSLYARDVEAEENGRSETLPEPCEGFAFTLRGLHCDDVQDWIAAESDRRQRLKRNVELTRREQMEVIRHAIGEKVIVDWSGLLDDSYQPIPFSRELARSIMRDRKWIDVADVILGVVLRRSRVHVEEEQAEGKASETSSATG